VPGGAAVLDGITMPDQVMVDGTQLRLNGVGLRTYSLLRIHVYVAALYLEHPSTNGEEVMHSPDKKRLDIRFLRDVDAEKGREAWRNGFADNCKLPCHLNPADVDRFLSEVQPVQRGDLASLTFEQGRVSFDFDGRPLGTIADPQFASVILATFIGPVPATERLKRELLGGAAS
jgi:hypothetical protein